MNRKFMDGTIGHDLPMEQLSVLFNVNNFIVSQTNPWVVPFLDYTSTDDIRIMQNPVFEPIIFLMHRFKEFVLSELKHRASQVSYIFPNAVTKFFNLVTQSYVGDITIWPKPLLSDYLRLLENPTSYAAIMNFVNGGKHRTYPKVHHIRSTMMMEKEIDSCYRHIRNRSRLHFMTALREVEDAGEEEFLMKSVFEEGLEVHEEIEDDRSPTKESLHKAARKANLKSARKQSIEYGRLGGGQRKNKLKHRN
jgi:TAG lipase/steryl ester hydrolase/phospholipase A2/LPA acyltransferase